MSGRLNLTQSQIENVIERTRNNVEAAEYLGISKDTWKKYATMYYHRERTDVNLYEYHKYYSWKDKGIPQYIINKNNKKGSYHLQAILNGEHPEYRPANLRKRLINNAILKECCNQCGYDERRISDYSIPLILHYKDNNTTNHRLENLELLCYNCFYILVGDFKSSIKKMKEQSDSAY